MEPEEKYNQDVSTLKDQVKDLYVSENVEVKSITRLNHVCGKSRFQKLLITDLDYEKIASTRK